MQDVYKRQTVYSVDLTWEDMTFTYNESGARTWDPDTHTYTAVSYTHLDVYKRQLLERQGKCQSKAKGRT